jgi:hypothetical protein
MLGLAGCGHESMEVTRVARLSAGDAARFTLLLSDQEQNDPEFLRYAQALSGQLQARGFVPVASPKEARYAVVLNLSEPLSPDELPAPSAPAAADRGDVGAGHGGIGGPGGGGVIGAPGGSGAGAGISHGTVVEGEGRVQIAMFDLTRPERPDEKVFAAEVTAPVKPGHDPAFAAMIAAAFKDFPGKGKQDFTVKLPEKERK